MKGRFFGGVHPPDRKALSAGVVPIPAEPPAQVKIPLQQHIGVPCRALVEVGEQVLRYQKIGDGDGLCVPVHASVSGRVVAIQSSAHVSGRMVEAIVIENDFLDTPAPLHPAAGEEPEQVLRAIREAGIVGMGGAAFPGNVKALSALGQVDTLIGNACECEPYITADDALLRMDARRVLEGLGILAKLLRPEKVILAVEDNKPEAIRQVEAVLVEFPGIRLQVLPTRYPQGAEKQLIYALTGREVPPGKLPVAVGCGVFNVSTCAAIARAVHEGIPLTERIVTVSGEAVASPGNFVVRIGTPFRQLLEAAKWQEGSQHRVISGGPMMGKAQEDLSVPVVKATNCVLCLPEEKTEANQACLRCGRCVVVCPMRLQPLYLYRYVQTGDMQRMEELHLQDCLECGCCSFGCPGKLPLVEHFRRGKQKLRKERGSDGK